MNKELPPAKQYLYLAIGLALFLVIFFLPEPQPIMVGTEAIPLTQGGKLCLGLLVVAIFFWMTEVFPFHLTALGVMLLMPALRVTDGIEVVKNGTVIKIAGMAEGYRELVRISFGNDLLLFFLGVFLLTGAFSITTLGRRMVLKMMQILGLSTKGVILGFLIMGTLLSMWVSEVGVAAIMLPIGVGILKQAGCTPLKSNFGKALMIASCWGPTFGGVGTPAGCGANPVAINFMRTLVGMKISFLDWMMIGIPTAFILIPFGWAILLILFPPELKTLPLTREDIRDQLRELGRLSKQEIGTIFIFTTVIALWIFNPIIAQLTQNRIDLPISYVAIFGGILLFLPPFNVLDHEKAAKAISWDSILLIMASVGLGMMTYYTGAAKWMAVALLGGIQSFSPVALIFAVVLVVTLMKLFLASNTVTGIIITPILISLALSFDIHPWILVAPAAFTSSLGIILVTQTPTNIIPYTSGYFTLIDFAKAGILMSIVIAIVITAVIAILGPLTGIYTY